MRKTTSNKMWRGYTLRTALGVILFMLVLLTGGASAATPVNSCTTTISSPGMYTLNANPMRSDAPECFALISSHGLFDRASYMVDTSNTYGASVYSPLTSINFDAKNLRFTDGSFSTNSYRTVDRLTLSPASTVIQVTIDINPKSINPKNNGTIKVTINSTSAFDVSRVNISSVRFGPNRAMAVNSQTPKNKLVLFFNTQDTGIKCGDTQVTLTGKTIDGLDIEGTDTIKTVGCEIIPPLPGAPDITAFSPPSPMSDVVGATRSFNITINQTANVIWYINGTEVFNQTGVNESAYTNTSAAQGIWNISAAASNANGSDIQTWIWNVTAPVPGAPSITNFAPTSPVNDTIGATRTFNITINQTVNVTWYINGTEVFNQIDVNESTYTNTSTALGTWNVTAVAANTNGTAVQNWIWNVTSQVPTPGSPAIIGFAPSSPVNDTVGATRIFSITVNQTVNITWYINGTPVQTNMSVSGANYTNTSAVLGVWNVTATAANTNGTAMQTWIWNVTQPIVAGAPNITSFIPSMALVNDTVGATRTFSVTVNQTASITWYINSTPVQTNTNVSEANYTNISAAQGTWIVNATATNANGTVSQEWIWTVTQGSQLPPDPSAVAPPVDTSVATKIAASTAFLYTGSNPIQTGVAPGTIEARRAAVLRGRVLNRDGTPLPGVNISIPSHPEFGSTLSRADGMFDMAVNGGGLLTVNYEIAGYLTAQRQENAPWQDYAWLPDVVMIQADANITNINLSSNEPIQVARGGVVNDSDGTRQATLLFPQGIQANVTLPNGTTQALTTMHVHATEYTVGANGPNAMPAELPPNSGYTYAVEFSVDEAPGASEITFNQPIPFYVENFINFNVGTTIPMGYYNRSLGQWVASDNGIVIKILNITGGMASIDVDGSNQPANTSQLAALNITDSERQELAILYQSNQSLWRMPIPHFTLPWDANLGFRCKDNNCEFPKRPDPRPIIPPHPCLTEGSIIGCQNQELGEPINIVGTPFILNYQSGRVPGHKVDYTLNISLSGATLPPELVGIVLEISVAGRSFLQNFGATPNLGYTFIWDGKDAFNRTLEGQQPITVKIGYTYNTEYIRTDRFGYNGNGLISVSCVNCQARQNMILWQRWNGWIGSFDARGQGIGGWSLNVHHAYDPNGRVLYMGDGERRNGMETINNVINTVAGNGNMGYSGDNGLATQAMLGGEVAQGGVRSGPNDIAVGQDGSIYIADSWNNRIRKVGPDGNITTVAGNGGGYDTGDGGSATQASISYPYGVAVGQDGSIYISVSGNRIRRVGPDGIITTIAGNGNWGYSGDGGPATQANLHTPTSVAVGQDGSIYIDDSDNYRIRRVGPDGIITTVAGNGNSGYSGDGGPATQASLSLYTESVAVGQGGSIYIVDNGNKRIRRVGPDGIITTVAGNGNTYYNSDGGPATQASLEPMGVAVANDGSIYIADRINNRIRHVDSDGNITTVAGNGAYINSVYGGGGDGGPATYASLAYPSSVAVGQDGSVYIDDTNNWRIRSVSPLLPGFSTSDLVIPSEDGSEIYVFNINGKHLRTLDALTGATRYNFTYDTAGRLINVADSDNNTLTIERDAGGNATVIISPYGQHTDLTLDANGYLASIIDPAGESTMLSYTTDGLLTKMTDPRNNVHNFSYDLLGRLVGDEDPAGGFKTLNLTELSDGYLVTLATGMNRNTTYQVEQLPTGDQLRVNTDPSGLKTSTTIGTNGGVISSYPDGAQINLLKGPDPRFGMQAPILSSLTETTPGGLTQTIASSRSETLANPNDPLSLQFMNDSFSINGRTFTSSFNAISRTITTQTPMGRTGITTIDNNRRIVESQVPGITPMQFTYDARGRLTSTTQGTRTYTLSYDAQGHLANITDPLSRTVSYAYDAAGRVTTQTLEDGRQIQYTYDTNGNIISITPPGRPDHAFNYTPVDLIRNYTPPDVGTGPTSTLYTYNPDRQLIQVTRPDGATVNLNYDSAGRLSTITHPTGTISMAYDSAGRLNTITAPDGGTIKYSYDGNLLTDNTWSGAISGSVHRTYDNNFNIVSESVNGGNTVNLQYDMDGLLTQAGLLNMSRDPQNGLLTGTSIGNITDTIGYNSFDEVATYQAAYSGANIFAVNYTRDNIGRIIQKNEMINGTTHTYAYVYDLAGRLTNVNKDGVMISQYVYDANGNRLSYTNQSGTISGSYDNQDRLLQYGTTTYNYTANGELTSKTNGSQTTTYQYDALGNLHNVRLPDGTSIEYVIDGNNSRIGKKVNGVLIQGFLYKDNLRPIAELDGSNNVVSRFVYTNKGNVPDYMIKSGRTYRIITDNIGSPRLVIDISSGTIVQQIDYDEFGNVILDTNPGFQPFGFAGGIYDKDTKLIRFGARDYDSQIGRWTKKDPILFNGGNTNLYGYVVNDPINVIDISGLGVPPEYAGYLCVGFKGVVIIVTTGVGASVGALGGPWGVAIGGAAGFAIGNLIPCPGFDP